MSFTISSRLPAPADAVWARVTSRAGLDDEFRPLLRMTLPRGLERLDPGVVPLGTPVGRCWILLGGLLPIDYDDLCLVELEAGRFLERSRTSTQRVWEHERTVVADGAGCVVTDRLAWTPRRLAPAPLLAAAFRVVFRHRHRRLRRRFGSRAQ